jgi:hypothetical protein
MSEDISIEVKKGNNKFKIVRTMSLYFIYCGECNHDYPDKMTATEWKYVKIWLDGMKFNSAIIKLCEEVFNGNS